MRNNKKLKQMESFSKMEIQEMVVLAEALREAVLDRNLWYLHLKKLDWREAPKF